MLFHVLNHDGGVSVIVRLISFAIYISHVSAIPLQLFFSAIVFYFLRVGPTCRDGPSSVRRPTCCRRRMYCQDLRVQDIFFVDLLEPKRLRTQIIDPCPYLAHFHFFYASTF